MRLELNINTRIWSGVLLFASLWVLSACAVAPQTKALFERPSMPVKNAVELTEVPFFPQEKYQCGPAALATVLNYQKIEVSPEALVSAIYVPKRRGSFQLEILAATRQYGQVAYVIDPLLDSLLKEIEAGNPVLVLQNLGFDNYPIWHFSVVIGYDLKTSKILLRSGTTRRWQTTLANFEQTWRRSDYWGVVITNPTHLPATATPSNWLRFAYDLESVGQFNAAETAYQTATAAWPDSKNAWLALTNLYYQQNRNAEALGIFQTIMPTFSTSTEMWNNYAYILQANGCDQAALQTAQCGLKLAPDDQNLQATVAEMRSTSKQTPAQPNCPFIDCFQK